MSEKTEQPSPKRLRKARQDGDVAKSAEFTGVAVMLAALGAITASAESIAVQLMAAMRRSIALATTPGVGRAEIVGGYLMESLNGLMLMIAPLLGAVFAISALISYVQIGAIFTIKPLTPDANKLNAINGLKNMVNKDKVVDLVKNLLKLSLMFAIGYSLLMDALPQLAPTPRASLPRAFVVFNTAAFDTAKNLVGALVFFGVADLFWTRHKWTKKHMMSKDEVTREYKESEGDPMIKSKRKQLHQEMMNEASMGQVKKADAVVVNPTHVAAAISYVPGEMMAPEVIVSGRGDRAKAIKDLARKHDVPIVKQVALARALVEVDSGDPIPEELYGATAEVLRFVYTLRAEREQTH